jgi:hypothetical protein
MASTEMQQRKPTFVYVKPRTESRQLLAPMEKERERAGLSFRTATVALLTLQRAQLVVSYSMVVAEGPY